MEDKNFEGDINTPRAALSKNTGRHAIVATRRVNDVALYEFNKTMYVVPKV